MATGTLDPGTITFMSDDPDVINEVETFFTGSNVKIHYILTTLLNTQDIPTKQVMIDKCRKASECVGGPVLVEATVLKIFLSEDDSLSQLVMRNCSLTENMEGKRARVYTYYAYSPDSRTTPLVFYSVDFGKIVPPCGTDGFGGIMFSSQQLTTKPMLK